MQDGHDEVDEAEALERRRKAAERATGTYAYEEADIDGVLQQRLRRKQAAVDAVSAAISAASAAARRRPQGAATQQSEKEALAAALSCTVCCTFIPEGVSTQVLL
jgi:hypothetical protein